MTQSTLTTAKINQATEPARDQKFMGGLKPIIKNIPQQQHQHQQNQQRQTYEPPRVVTTTTLIEGCRDRKLTGKN